MKKLYLSITLLGMFFLMFAITLIPTQAYTFNGSYNFSNIDLNASLSELNGASLNDLFDYDYINYLYLNEFNGKRNKFELDGNEVVFKVYVDYHYIERVDINFLDYANKRVWIFLPFTKLDNFLYSDTIGIQDLGLYSRVSTIIPDGLDNSYYLDTNNLVFMDKDWSFGDIEIARDYFDDRLITYHVNPYIITDVSQSLFYWNLENINIDLINYYFAVYLLNKFDLPIGDLWSYAFTAGQSNGYDEGYIDGNADGYFDGYDDGYEEGNVLGYNIGFNEGRDDAIDNNFTLMGLVELIIGVVLSMVGWVLRSRPSSSKMIVTESIFPK